MRIILDQFHVGLNGVVYISMMCFFSCILVLSLFKGKLKNILIRAIITLIIELIIELTLSGVLYLLVQVNIFSNRSDYTYIEAYIGKIIEIPVMYICFIVLDMWKQKSEEKLIKRITAINLVIGLIQIFMLFDLIQQNRFIFEENAFMITIISNMVILVGYIIITEVFGEISRQQKKRARWKNSE